MLMFCYSEDSVDVDLNEFMSYMDKLSTELSNLPRNN